jgi:hypothetical protein
MSPMPRSANQPAQASTRRRRTAPARLTSQHAPAQPSIEALHQALQDWEVPETLVAAIAGRGRAQPPRLGHSVARRCPTLLGYRHGQAHTRGRGGHQPLPAPLLGALPQRAWRTRRRRVARERRVARGRHPQAPSAAPPRRWPWRWRVEAAGCRTDGTPCGRVGPGARGPCPPPGPGIAGVRRWVVMGDGTRRLPVDWALRRPPPPGPGRRGPAPLVLPQPRLAERVAAWAQRGGTFPTPRVGAARWGRDATGRRSVANAPRGPRLVPGQRASPFPLEDGRTGNGADVGPPATCSWPQRRHAPGCRAVRRRAGRPPAGHVLRVVVDQPGAPPVSLRARSLTIQGTRLMQAGKQRHGSEQRCRILATPWSR